MNMEQYLKPVINDNRIMVFVDGSYDVKKRTGGSGQIIVIPHENTCTVRVISKPVTKKRFISMRNVVGELEGVLLATSFIVDNALRSSTKMPVPVDLYYDYTGIEEWALGKWKTNNEFTTFYKEYMVNMSQHMELKFHKIKSHSGDFFNDNVDLLAKLAAFKEKEFVVTIDDIEKDEASIVKIITEIMDIPEIQKLKEMES